MGRRVCECVGMFLLGRDVCVLVCARGGCVEKIKIKMSN